MTTFEKIMAVLNLIAVLLIPVVAVIVGQYLQERAQKRKDKMQIFQCLMTRRITGWAALEAVNAINSIDIVFTDNKEIRNQLGIWRSKCKKDVAREEQYREKSILFGRIRSTTYNEQSNYDRTSRVGQSSRTSFTNDGQAPAELRRQRPYQRLNRLDR